MKIKFIEASLFKGFQKSSVEFNPGLNLLVGANNSGKSSLLQAIYLAFHFLSVTGGISEKDKKNKNKLKGVMLKSFPIPLHDNAAISEGLKKRSLRGEKSTYFKVEMNNSVSFMEGLTFPGGNPLVISSNFEGMEGNKEYREKVGKIIKNKLPLFIPIFAGVTNQEEIKTKEVVSYYVTSGKSSEVLRNQLKEMPRKNFETLNKYLKDSFDIEILANETHEIYLSSVYKEDKYNNLDISLAGSGFQQILQILVYIVSFNSDIILIDEPDAHLHYRLQNLLYKILSNLVKDGKQIIIATHSQIFIKNAIEKNDHLVLVNKKSEKQKSINEYNDYLKALYEDGLLDEEDITEKKEIKFIFLEDSDKGFKVMKIFLEKLGIKESEYKIISSNGEADGDIKYLKKSRDIDNLKFKALIIKDSDSIPREYLEKIKNKNNDKDISVCFTDVNEIENYLINAKLISKVINQKNKKLKTKEFDIQQLINRVVNKNKDNLFDTLDGCLEGKLKECYRDVDLEFSKIQSTTRNIKKEIRDNNFKYPFEKLPGKEMLGLIKEEIQNKYKVKILETDIAYAFEISDVPKLIKESLKFF